MQGMNGLELAKTIRTNEPNALIIFLTSYSEYVFDVFEVITFDFLLKPITFKRFQKVLQKASTYLNMNKKLFSFSYCKKNFSIPCSEIMYIDKSGRKAFLHTPSEKIVFKRRTHYVLLIEFCFVIFTSFFNFDYWSKLYMLVPIVVAFLLIIGFLTNKMRHLF